VPLPLPLLLALGLLLAPGVCTTWARLGPHWRCLRCLRCHCHCHCLAPAVPPWLLRNGTTVALAMVAVATLPAVSVVVTVATRMALAATVPVAGVAAVVTMPAVCACAWRCCRVAPRWRTWTWRWMRWWQPRGGSWRRQKPAAGATGSAAGRVYRTHVDSRL